MKCYIKYLKEINEMKSFLNESLWYKWCRKNQSPPNTHHWPNAQLVPEQCLPWEKAVSPPVLLLSTLLHGMKHLLGQLWSASLFVSPPRPFVKRTGRRRRPWRSWHCVSTHHLKHWCVTNTVLVINLKYTTVLAVMKKNNLPPSQNQYKA